MAASLEGAWGVGCDRARWAGYVEELRSWVYTAPVTFTGNDDRGAIGNVLQFTQEADETDRERLFCVLAPSPIWI